MEELRNIVYYWTLELIKKGDILKGIILMLSTWNIAGFRYVIKNFPLEEFKKALEKSNFDFFENMKFEDAFDKETENEIMRIYTTLSDIEGIKYVGASKILHFMCPNFFVMWDNKILDDYKEEERERLNVKKLPKNHLNTSPEGYLNFMNLMQEKYKNNEFKNLDLKDGIPRAIDIYNYKKYSE